MRPRPSQVPGYGPGRNTEQRAMGEGFGDFLAAYSHLADGNAGYQADRRFCVGEWDAVSYNPASVANPGSGCLRWVDGTNERNGSDVGRYRGTPSEEHNDGRYWSAMLTCVFEGIEPSLGTEEARNRILTLVLAHNFDLVPTATNTAFADSLAALRAEDDNLFEGEDVAFIDQCGQQRLAKAAPDGHDAPGRQRVALAREPRRRQRLVPQRADRDVEHLRTGVADMSRTAARKAPTPPTRPARRVSCTVTSQGGSTSKSFTLQEGRHPAVAGGDAELRGADGG